MDTGSVSLSQYTYQTTLASSGQKSAVLQALAGTYAAVAGSGSDDPLAAAAGSSAMGALVGGITTLTGGKGTKDAAYAATYGGLNVSSATSLLASLGSGSDGTSGLQGFGASVDARVSLAATAYQAQKTYASAATGTTPATTSASTSDAAALVAAQNAAAGAVTSTLSLLA
jgi:hypothetical protein